MRLRQKRLQRQGRDVEAVDPPSSRPSRQGAGWKRIGSQASSTGRVGNLLFREPVALPDLSAWGLAEEFIGPEAALCG